MTIELMKQEGKTGQWTVRHYSGMGDIRYQINLTADEALWSIVSIMTKTGYGYLKTSSQQDADKEKFEALSCPIIGCTPPEGCKCEMCAWLRGEDDGSGRGKE